METEQDKFKSRREDILIRLYYESGLGDNLTTEVKQLMRQAYNWGALIERDRIKGVFGKASVDAFSPIEIFVGVKDLK